MRRIGALGTTLALFGAVMLVGVAPASAHVPSVSASCSGVHLSGTKYDGTKANTWSATIGGTTTSGTFGASLDMTIPVPQGGASTAWTATVQAFDGSYKDTESGTVGPCGTPTKPADKVEHRDIVDKPNCTEHTVTTEHQSRTIPFVLVDNAWVPGTPTAWVTDSTSSRTATLDDCCPPGHQPPADTQTREVVDAPDCTTYTVTTEHQSRTRTYSFDDKTWSWVAGDWSEWATDSTTSVPSTAVECPGPQPDATVTSTHRTQQKCGDDFATTTTETTTTDFALDASTGTWNPGTPVVVTTTSTTPVAVVDCVVHHKVDPAVVDTAVLPNTGAPSLYVGVAAILLLITGSFILWSLRRTVADD